jgi:hypothetical protein
VQAIIGASPAVLESHSRDWVPLFLSFCATKFGGIGASEGRREQQSDDQEADEDGEAALAGATASRTVCHHAGYTKGHGFIC